MIGIGVIGYGYWGPNLVRNFNESPGCRLVGVSDLSEKNLGRVRARYPDILATTSSQELIEHPDVQAIVVATPTKTHFPLAMAALKAGKHVFVEKPLASSSEEARQLHEEATKRNLVLMVDHTFVYTGAIRKIKSIMDEGKIGKVLYYDSVRVNLGLFQSDVNVLWDLAVHDLAIMDYLLDQRQPHTVSATGMAHVQGQPENLAYMTCIFDDNLIAHIHANWLAPAKIRRTLIGGDKQMIVYDDLDPSERVKVYDKGITTEDDASRKNLLIGYRSGDVWCPRIDPGEALQMEAEHFAHCIEKGERPTTDGEAGLRVVRIIEAATQSMKDYGKPVHLK